jgi:hypothetical protein
MKLAITQPAGGLALSAQAGDPIQIGVRITASSAIAVAVPGSISGPTGPAGPAGASITAGSGLPTGSAPAGALYIDTTTGDLWEYA